jgi:hypothetical protein
MFILVDAAAVDNNARISPENNMDFYAYSQGAPYSVKWFFCIFIENIDYIYIDATID